YPDLKPKGIAASAREKLAEQGEAGFISLAPAVRALDRSRQAILSIGRSAENRKAMDQTFDAADNQATIAGQQARSHLDIGSTPIERDAAMAIVEANGNRNNLTRFLSQARAGDNNRAIAAVQYAQANWARLQPLATRVSAALDAQLAAENAAGIATEFHEAYVPHIYDMDLLMGGG